ncbi:MAG: hypothetical protein ABL993_13620 [Vicinamibacterales bacterium]
MPDPLLATLVGLMIAGGLSIFGLAGRLRASVVASLGLVVAMLGGFYLYVVFSPASPTNTVLSVALFLGSAILFRLLSSFESPR